MRKITVDDINRMRMLRSSKHVFVGLEACDFWHFGLFSDSEGYVDISAACDFCHGCC